MTLINFIELFPDEESCKLKFKEYREHVGVVCSKCGGKDHYWKKDKEQYECKLCKTRTTLKSGTVMHKSKLPFRYWFITMHLLTSTKKSFSAKEIQRQLGHKRYQPIWHMVHKLREVMGKRDEEYILAGRIELDEGYFSTEISEGEKDKPLKRGRGSQKKTKMLVMAESEMVASPKKGQKPRRVGYLKMKVIEDFRSETIDNIVKELASNATAVDTDDSTSYVNLKKYIPRHNAQVIPKEKVGEILPWVHIAISNAKRQLINTFHDIKPEFLQNYLDEFCYKFNRRYYGEALFNRLLVASVSYKNEFRYKSG
ncbi:MAG: IS1595 family transposase [Bacteroidales bacterium]|nr:IS1595 family transposase [Bacteroidales bacterium]